MPKPTVDELNAMSGPGLVYSLGKIPKDERKALIASLDDAATRRYVHATLTNSARWIGPLVVGLVLLGLLAAVR